MVPCPLDVPKDFQEICNKSSVQVQFISIGPDFITYWDLGDTTYNNGNHKYILLGIRKGQMCINLKIDKSISAAISKTAGKHM